MIDDLAGEEYTFDRAGVAGEGVWGVVGGSGRVEGGGGYCRRCATEARWEEGLVFAGGDRCPGWLEEGG